MCIWDCTARDRTSYVMYKSIYHLLDIQLNCLSLLVVRTPLRSAAAGTKGHTTLHSRHSHITRNELTIWHMLRATAIMKTHSVENSQKAHHVVGSSSASSSCFPLTSHAIYP